MGEAGYARKQAVRFLRWLLVALSTLAASEATWAQDGPAGVSPALMFGCNQSAFYDGTTLGATQLVASNASGRIYVCGWNLWVGAGATNVGFVYGTGVNCAVGTTKVTPAYQFAANTGMVDHLPVYTGITPVPNGSNLCINTNAANAVQAVVYYTQF